MTDIQIRANKEHKFREDIQGLRAIAVMAVVIFHINPWLLAGGFIGVDIFFVISGYLITGIIWRDLSNGSFSFADFYSRRVKRLFPALFAVCIACILLAYIVFLPEEINLFGKSVIASLFYFSNFFFYSQTDYFASDLQFSPLLHTWSLSVEEQFYLFFPLLMVLLYKKCPQKVVAILIGIAIVSLILSEALLDYDKSLSFFASPTRFFQFLAGGLIAILPNVSRGRLLKEVMNLAGLALIGLCILLVSEETPFPGINALYPTLATAMILFAGQTPGLLTSRLLSLWPAQFLGKISYSLYLWHWPVIVFYQIEVSAAPSKLEKLGLLGLCILLGYLSWRFIENAFRHKSSAGSGWRPIYAATAFSLFLSGIGAVLAFSDGLKFRFNEQQLFLSQYISYDPKTSRSGTCFLTQTYNDLKFYNQTECIKYEADKPNYLLIGDSHAAHFYGAIHDMVGEVNLTQVTASGCRPTTAFTGSDYCTSLMRWAYEELILTHDFDAIIVSGNWKKGDVDSLKQTVDRLSRHTDKVIFLGPIMTYDQALPRLLARSFPDFDQSYLLEKASNYDQARSLDKSIKQTLAQSPSLYISILDVICPKGDCVKVTTDGIPMQWDYGHLTYEGARDIVGKLIAAKQL